MKRIFIVLLFFIISYKAHAAELKTIYNASYYPDFDGNAKVIFKISVENLDNTTYINEYGLTFPRGFEISNILAKDRGGPIKANLEKNDKIQSLKLFFNQPSEFSSITDFDIEFNQKNLFNSKGTAWEILLPTLADRPNTVYNIWVYLPEKISENKKLSIAKPAPTNISGNTIYWENVAQRTVYAVFGASQYYKLDLIYNLKNEEEEMVYYEVAFPPETLFQKIIVSSIIPLPEKVYLDEDGNYIGRYTLDKNAKRQVKFSGYAEIRAIQDDDMLSFISESIEKQESYLLSVKPFWGLGSFAQTEDIKSLKDESQIYQFVKNNLTYNYSKLGDKNIRFGAERVLKERSNAVCMEFTDLFIGLAREKGIMSRELNGYAYSFDNYLRPLSLVSNLLHSWPEYYNPKAAVWIPVDPTWDNTSGIDYFNSLDLNHIVFAIHGKDSSYPASAGTYEESRSASDVKVVPVSRLPERKKNIIVSDNLKSNIISGKKTVSIVTVKNQGNYFLKDLDLRVESDSLEVFPTSSKISLLAPYSEKKISISYLAKKNQTREAQIEYFVEGEKTNTKNVKIFSLKRYFIPYIVSFSLFTIILSVILYKKKLKKYDRQEDI